VTLLGALAPRLLYGPGARGSGPLFVPVALAASVGTSIVLAWLARSALSATGVERRRRGAIALACSFGAIAGAGPSVCAYSAWS